MKDFMAVPIPVLLLGVVFVLTAMRKIKGIHLPIWLVVTVAASIVLLTGQINLSQAFDAIDFDILCYLFGVFIIGAALEESHYLEYAMLRLFKRARTGTHLLGLIIIFCSLSTVVLMNDTVAIVGVPAILLLCRKTKIPPLPLLLTLAYTLTISSVTSPIANPQNLLIANTLANPLVTFFYYLLIPTIINCLLLFYTMRFIFKKDLCRVLNVPEPMLEVDKSLARLAKIAMILLISLIGVKTLLSLVGSQLGMPFSLIAIVAATPILLGHSQRIELLKKIDWHTLLFFVSLFIFIESVWLSHYFQALINDLHLHLQQPLTITSISLTLSQLISNVPLVILYLPFLKTSPESHVMILAMASTVAGNLFILGAASNVIIIQNAEKRRVKAFNFWQFSACGIPLCLLNVVIYYFWISVIYL